MLAILSSVLCESSKLTVAAGLDGCLNVADALDGNTVLVVAVDVLVLKLADFIEKNSKLVGNVGNVLVASLAPDGKLLLEKKKKNQSVIKKPRAFRISVSATYSNFHALLGNSLHAAHDVLLHLHQLREFLGQIRPEGTARIATEGMACAELSVVRSGRVIHRAGMSNWPQCAHRIGRKESLLTKATLAEEAARLGRRRRRRGVLRRQDM